MYPPVSVARLYLHLQNMLLLQKHFDDAQYESHRADGLRKLRPDAVPMLFAVRDIASIPVIGQNTTRKRPAPVDHRK